MNISLGNYKLWKFYEIAINKDLNGSKHLRKVLKMSLKFLRKQWLLEALK